MAPCAPRNRGASFNSVACSAAITRGQERAMANDDRPERELNGFWNELIQGPGEVVDIDAEVAATVRRIHSMAATRPPDTARERVRRGMNATFNAQANRQESWINGAASMSG